MNKLNQLNLKVLVPMYFEGNYEELCERADALGMDSLTEDEQYFINNYNRLDEMYKICEDCPYYYGEVNLCMYGEEGVPNNLEKKCNEGAR